MRKMAADNQNTTKYFKQITSFPVNKGKNNCRDTKKLLLTFRISGTLILVLQELEIYC